MPFSELELGSQAEWVSGVATLLAAIIALAGYGVIEWQRRHAIKLDRRKTAHSIGRKIVNLAGQLDDIKRHFEPFIQGWVHDKTKGLPNIAPMIGMTFDSYVRLDKGEAVLLVELTEVDFLSQIDLLVSALSSLVVSVNEYRILYDSFYEKLPPPVVMNENVGSHPMTKEAYLPLLAHKIAIYNFVADIRSMSKESAEKAQSLSLSYHPMMKHHFKGEKFILVTN